MTLNYRLATASDAARLSEMGSACFIETFEGFYPPADLYAGARVLFDAAVYDSQIEGGVYSVILAEDGEDIAGFAKVGPMSLPVPAEATATELKQLYVGTRWWGTGVAAALMERVIEQARKQERTSVYLSVYAKNDRAIAFYKRCGFVIVGEAPFTVGSQIDIDPVMRLDLGERV